jgi:hypothetical protein
MKKISVEDRIVQKLSKGALEKNKLIKGVQKASECTVQAVYKELRKLLGESAITIHKDSVSLTLLYIEKELARWEETSRAYNTRHLSHHFLDLREGESLSLKFKNFNELDAYWVHAFILLEKELPENFPTYSVTPHDWFYYGRRETDIFWTKKQRRLQRLVVTHPTQIDREVVRHRIKAGFEITPGKNPLKQEEYEYYTILGDWIFKILLDKKINLELVEFIKNTKSLEDLDSFAIQKILSKKGVSSMKISRNKKLAERMTQKLKKYFE